MIIDFSTLTGAARVALGPELPAAFTDDEGAVTYRQRTDVPVADGLAAAEARKVITTWLESRGAGRADLRRPRGTR